MNETNWSVEIVTRGRDGNVIYREDSNAISFYWEFGGTVVAIVHVEPASRWDECYPWAAGRRQKILERLVSEIIRQKARGCWASMDEENGTILFRENPKAGGREP